MLLSRSFINRMELENVISVNRKTPTGYKNVVGELRKPNANSK